MSAAFFDSPALIIGWGRIGKCLAQKLLSLGCPTTIAVRSARDQAVLNVLGYTAISIADIPATIHQYTLLFNTVPHTVLTSPLPSDILALELASTPGIPEMHTIDGRGLPGKLAPISSGKLIAETVLPYIQEDFT
jgi:dipicolinate synthase subunit A